MTCTKTPDVACVRRPGHKGMCTVAPSASTLDWDDHYQERRREHESRVETLLYLDFETPWYADLNDEEPA